MSRVLTATRTPCPKCGGRAYRLRSYGASTKRKADQQEIECRGACPKEKPRQ